MEGLLKYRKKIDKIDAELLRLFNERMEVAAEIALYKKENGIPISDPQREQELLSAISEPYSKKLYAALFEMSREYQSAIIESKGVIPRPSGAALSPASVEGRACPAELPLPINAGKRRLLVINGPNINMLGIREPELYGSKTYADLLSFIQEICTEADFECECIQSNCEGEIVTAIQKAHGKAYGIIINPAAYTHTSVAILDALKAVSIPAVEVHLTNPQKRADRFIEEFRKVSYISRACERTFSGLGFESYAEAIRYLAGRTE
ncbi:MAG: type II 3-dehydroquinate dehydratase [Oscillospiraceae bacterium]|nr:type II 3-dehydroquinate dehydratase [Oscillospiraceae bacterium]